MKWLLVILFAVIVFSHAKQLTEEEQQLVDIHLKGSNFKCTICVVAVTIVQNEAGDHKEAIENVLKKVCDYVPAAYNATCRVVVSVFGEEIVKAILRKDNPSKICNDLAVFQCNGCSLNSAPKDNVHSQRTVSPVEEAFAFLLAHSLRKSREIPSPSNNINELLPVADMDKDFFSPFHIYRGADWRGKDCNDTNASVRPGVYDTNPAVDSNCNGISGVNEQGQSYEDLFCKNSEAKTLVMFGDSASSAFHIPPEWLHLENITKLFTVLDDEFDFPQLSYSTGFSPDINGESIYLQLRERNLCNHRDYQNVGHNGYSAHHMAEVEVPALTVNKNSKPLLAFIGYIGNDVCKDNLNRMTTPEQFGAALEKGFAALDAVAPANSKALVMGLVDGRILWDEMSQRIHPLGVTYEHVYSFLTCTDANPCKTWLTSNETTRNATSARAAELSLVAKKIVQSQAGKYKNIEFDYIDFPLQQAIAYCREHGISPSVLIEPFDGFHPSHVAHRLFSKLIWEYLEKNHPDWLGPVNPNNAMITKLFGDQGGY